MTRQIVCDACRANWEKIPDYPGEHRNYVRGAALREFRCDGCNKPIEPGETTTAFSLYRKDYVPWESEFLKL